MAFLRWDTVDGQCPLDGQVVKMESSEAKEMTKPSWGTQEAASLRHDRPCQNFPGRTGPQFCHEKFACSRQQKTSYIYILYNTYIYIYLIDTYIYIVNRYIAVLQLRSTIRCQTPEI